MSTEKEQLELAARACGLIPKEKDMNTQEVPDWMIDATNIPKAEALQTLAHRLPDGWNIQIDIERGAGSVTLYAPEDTMYEIDTGGESIEAGMLEALRFACWREKQTELAVDRAWAQFKTAMRFNAMYRDKTCSITSKT